MCNELGMNPLSKVTGQYRNESPQVKLQENKARRQGYLDMVYRTEKERQLKSKS